MFSRFKTCVGTACTDGLLTLSPLELAAVRERSTGRLGISLGSRYTPMILSEFQVHKRSVLNVWVTVGPSVGIGAHSAITMDSDGACADI